MSQNSCPYCAQVNPPGAKFCNACGGALHLVPCPRCGAVSDVTATTCYQCHAELPGRGAEAADAVAPAAGEISGPGRHRYVQVSIGLAVVTVVAALGYYGYLQYSVDRADRLPAASGEAPAGSGAVRREATAGIATPAGNDDDVPPALPATLPPEPALADAPGTAAERPPVEPRAANAAAGRIAPPGAAGAGTTRGQEPLRQEVCTEAIAALGLCAPASAERRE